MVCRILVDKPLSDLMLIYCQLEPLGQISVKFESKSAIFVLENEIENAVCIRAAILLRPQQVNLPGVRMCQPIAILWCCSDLVSSGPTICVSVSKRSSVYTVHPNTIFKTSKW